MITEDEKKKKLRSDCDYIWDKMDVFSKYIDKKILVEGISLTRKCISNPHWQAKYPTTDEIFNEWNKYDLERLAMLAEFEPLRGAGEIQQIKDMVTFCQRFHDNYDDLFPSTDKDGNLMLTYDQWRALRLQEQHEAVGSSYNPTVQAELADEKRLRTMYKKYVKEWRTKND